MNAKKRKKKLAANLKNKTQSEINMLHPNNQASSCLHSPRRLKQDERQKAFSEDAQNHSVRTHQFGEKNQ
jgi:hypothetical protein